MDSETSEPRGRPRSTPKAVIAAVAACAVVTAAALPLRTVLDPANTIMVYLLAVSLTAMWLGRTPAIVAAVASVLLFDFFFVEPRFSFAVADAQYLITFLVMLVVGLLIAALTARLGREAQQAAAREARARALYRLAHEVSGALDIGRVEALVREFLETEFGLDARLLLIGAGGALPPDGADLAIARRVLETGEAMPFVEPGSGAAALALPLNAPVRRRGVLLVRSRERDVAAGRRERPLLDAVAALTSTAVERIHFAEVASDAQVEVESERLRTSVLSAVSHDLRTPLTVLVGLADTLAGHQPSLPLDVGRAATDLREQAMRLSRMVENLLDMARLRAGRVPLRKAWQPVEEVVGSSVRAVEAGYPGREIAIAIDPELPLVEIDNVLIERVLVNLLDNALKHAPEGPVAISARRNGEAVAISVEDRGPGLPPGAVDRLFDMFERGTAPESHVPGAGMGLAIVKAILQAHGGSVRAANRDGGGASFTVTLPAGTPPAPIPGAAPGTVGAS